MVAGGQEAVCSSITIVRGKCTTVTARSRLTALAQQLSELAKRQGMHPPSPSHATISKAHSNPLHYQTHLTADSKLNPRYESSWESEEGFLKLSEFQAVLANQCPDDSLEEVTIRATFEIRKCNQLTAGVRD